MVVNQVNTVNHDSHIKPTELQEYKLVYDSFIDICYPGFNSPRIVNIIIIMMCICQFTKLSDDNHAIMMSTTTHRVTSQTALTTETTERLPLTSRDDVAPASAPSSSFTAIVSS